MSRKLAVISLVTVIGVIIDQATKYYARASEAVNSPEGLEIIPHWFGLRHAENPGAALGMLGDLSEPWRIGIFVVFTLVATGVVYDMYRRLSAHNVLMSFALGLVLSGAWGNLIDRVVKPIFGDKATVTDFLHVFSDSPSVIDAVKAVGLGGFCGPTMCVYPTFNVADINLVVGVGLFIVHYLFFESNEEDDFEE